MKISNTHHRTKAGVVKRNPKNMTLIVVYDGKKDYWGRRLYRNLYTGTEYVEVDGKLHTRTSEGEPDCPIKNKIVYKDNQ